MNGCNIIKTSHLPKHEGVPELKKLASAKAGFSRFTVFELAVLYHQNELFLLSFMGNYSIIIYKQGCGALQLYSDIQITGGVQIPNKKPLKSLVNRDFCWLWPIKMSNCLFISQRPPTYFLRCSCSFRNSSVLLLLTPEPLLYVLHTQIHCWNNTVSDERNLSINSWYCKDNVIEKRFLLSVNSKDIFSPVQYIKQKKV